MVLAMLNSIIDMVLYPENDGLRACLGSSTPARFDGLLTHPISTLFTVTTLLFLSALACITQLHCFTRCGL